MIVFFHMANFEVYKFTLSKLLSLKKKKFWAKLQNCCSFTVELFISQDSVRWWW